jgi:hypothetical protein
MSILIRKWFFMNRLIRDFRGPRFERTHAGVGILNTWGEVRSVHLAFVKKFKLISDSKQATYNANRAFDPQLASFKL